MKKSDRENTKKVSSFVSEQIANEITERQKQQGAARDELDGLEQSLAEIDTEIENCLLDCASGNVEAQKKVAGLEQDRQILLQQHERAKLTVVKIGQEIVRLQTERAEQIKREAVERITAEKYPAVIERLGRVDDLLDSLHDELLGIIDDTTAMKADGKIAGLPDSTLATRRFDFERSLIAAIGMKIHGVFDKYRHLPAPEFREPLAQQARQNFGDAKQILDQAIGENVEQQQAKVA